LCNEFAAKADYFQFVQYYISFLKTLAYIQKTVKWGATRESIPQVYRENSTWVTSLGKSVIQRFTIFRDVMADN
jgi:hypothetical protein